MNLDGGDAALTQRDQAAEMWATQLEDVRKRAQYACQYVTRNGSYVLATVPATWHPAVHVVKCASPSVPTSHLPSDGDSLEVNVSLSINGVDFGPSNVAFAFLPTPEMSGIFPLSGPSGGGTPLTINGTGFRSELNIECALDTAIAPATIDHANSLRCASPSLGDASFYKHDGVWYELGNLPLRGAAELLRSAVRLTSMFGDPASGALQVVIPEGTPGLTSFELSFLLMLPAPTATVAAAANDPRIALRYGPLPSSSFGGEGAAEGLSISLSDGAPPLSIEVRHMGTTLLSRVLGASLILGEWMRVTVTCREGVLTVRVYQINGFINDRPLAVDLVLPGWAPSRMWQMGIGAHGTRPGRYVREVRLRSALIFGVSAVPVRLQVQGQQYIEPPPPRLNFTYTADAAVSELSPASGPMSTSTAITIQGANFDLGLGVRCRFDQGGTTVFQPATLITNGSDAQINCTIAPTPWVPGPVSLYVLLGDIGAHGPGGTFHKYSTPTLHRLAPLIGVGSSTRVSVFGDGLTTGTDRRCKFGEAEANASIVPDSPTLLCVAPQNAVIGDVDVKVTLNGRQYTADGALLSFRYLTPGMVFVSSVSPRLGPSSGGTNVTVRGTNFVRLPESTTCSFGTASAGGGSRIVNATFVDTSTLLCAAPKVESTGPVQVKMSLNAQEYYGGASFLYSVSSTAIASTTPSSKGRSGGATTLVALQQPLAAGVTMRAVLSCRFGDPPCTAHCTETSATLVTSALVRCIVPHSPNPPDPTASSKYVQLWISLNGEQFSIGPRPFTYFEVDPEVHELQPIIGPIHGGTAIIVKGVGLTAGLPKDLFCRFGDVNTGVFGPPVQATAIAEDVGLRCVTPRTALAIDAIVEVRNSPPPHSPSPNSHLACAERPPSHSFSLVQTILCHSPHPQR